MKEIEIHVGMPIPDRLSPRPWRPPDSFDWDPYYAPKLSPDYFEVRPFSDWLEVLVRIAEGQIVEAVLRMNPLAIIDHWVADGVKPLINTEAA